MNYLIKKVNSLTKLVEKGNKKKQWLIRGSSTPPVNNECNNQKQKYHVLSDSDIEDKSSETQGEENSDSECLLENSCQAAKIPRLVKIQKEIN